MQGCLSCLSLNNCFEDEMSLYSSDAVSLYFMDLTEKSSWKKYKNKLKAIATRAFIFSESNKSQSIN